MTFKNVPDYEAPTDANRDNVYLVTVQADDGTSSELGTFDVMITVTNVNEAPEISGLTSIDVAENSTGTLAAYTAEDPESETVDPLQLSGADAGPFELSATGVLSVVTARDREAPTDTDRNNDYVVTIVAVAVSLVGMLDVTVTVTNVNEPPTIRGTTRSPTRRTARASGSSATSSRIPTRATQLPGLPCRGRTQADSSSTSTI